MADDVHWSLDKRVPLALVVTIMLQTGAAVWWASAISGTQEIQAKQIAALEAQRAGERLAVVEATIGDVKAQLVRIEAKIDRLTDRVTSSPHP